MIPGMSAMTNEWPSRHSTIPRFGSSVVGDFGSCGRNNRQQRRFARIGESHQSHIGKKFEFQNKCTLAAVLTGLRIARSLIGRGLEVPVAESAAPARKQHGLLPVLGHFADRLTRFGIACHGSERYVYHDVAAVTPAASGSRAGLSVFGEDMPFIFKVYERPVLAVAAQDYAGAASSVAAVRTAESYELLPAEMGGTGTAVSRATENLDVIYEIG